MHMTYEKERAGLTLETGDGRKEKGMDGQMEGRRWREQGCVTETRPSGKFP